MSQDEIIHDLRAKILEVLETDNLDSSGFCLACGEETSGVEPDAREYRCDSCDKDAVYGAEELLFHFAAL